MCLRGCGQHSCLASRAPSSRAYRLLCCRDKERKFFSASALGQTYWEHREDLLSDFNLRVFLIKQISGAVLFCLSLQQGFLLLVENCLYSVLEKLGAI